MKRITRREVKHWFEPIRKCFVEIRQTGETYAIKGYPATVIYGELTRLDWCIAGWVGCLKRLLPDADLQAMEILEKKFSNGVPITEREIDNGLRLLNLLEQPMTRLTRSQVKDAVLTEQIKIEFDEVAA